MTDQPLSSGEQSKILIFGLLLLPTIAFGGVGAIPTIFLVFGIYMMRKNSDFSHIETARKNFKAYTQLVFIVLMLTTFYWGYEAINNTSDYTNDARDNLLGFVPATFIPMVYLFLMNALFYRPLADHKDWVAANGIFTNKNSLAKKFGSDVDIIKREKMGSYSVADELMKWAKLKEDGLISEQEYQNAREKILNDN